MIFRTSGICMVFLQYEFVDAHEDGLNECMIYHNRGIYKVLIQYGFFVFN